MKPDRLACRHKAEGKETHWRQKSFKRALFFFFFFKSVPTRERFKRTCERTRNADRQEENRIWRRLTFSRG